MGDRDRFSKLIVGTIAGAATAAGYVLAVRPRILTWGATEDEVTRSLPGDELVLNPKMEATHTITIHASAAEVWPWLVQIGHQRAGWYSYEWIHRLMGIAGSVEHPSRSAERILPQLQDLEVGDIVEIAPDMGYNVVEIQPKRALVLHIAVETDSFRPFDPKEEMPSNYFNSSWTWFLDERAGDVTRLIVRIRVGYSPGLANALMVHGLMEPGSFVMERRTLLGIKRRVEASTPALVD